jgi:hypothetical protein
MTVAVGSLESTDALTIMDPLRRMMPLLYGRETGFPARDTLTPNTRSIKLHQHCTITPSAIAP